MRVTLEEFERYLKLSKEARGLEKELAALKKKNSRSVKNTIVKGSMNGHPWIKRSFPVENILNNSRAVRKREGELAQKRAEILTLGARLDGFLKTVKDIEIRDILILHYIDGVTFRQLPQYLGREGDGSSERKRIKAYFERL